MTSVFSFVSNEKAVLPIIKLVLKSEIAQARGRDPAWGHDPL